MLTVVTEAAIDACGFRMFDLPEIARTMVMHDHPTSGGDYLLCGNKRERMAQLGNAVTPPATRLKLERLFEVIGGGTFTDLFCGAGGSSIGATQAGAELKLGLNHWRRAIETHAENFPDADHDCADVSALTTAQIRRYPDTDILLASPECTNHSLAKGAQRRKPKHGSLFEDGPAGDDEQDRSRATMWDVVRFAEQKLLKGRPYKAIVVENVVDAYRWGANDDGGLFAAWRMALTNLGYTSEIVWLNSMFAWPTPQSRDRMYVVCWLKGISRPNLEIEPVSWCPHCERVVNGVRRWKRPARPLETPAGKPVGARYGVQYLYGCPDCHQVVLPGVFPAASAIDWTVTAPLIGERARPLAANTRERIRRGLELLAAEPFAIRLLQGGIPRPLTLPVVTLTQRHDLAIVVPHSTGGIAKFTTEPVDTLTSQNKTALVFTNRAHAIAGRAATEPARTVCSGGHLGVVVAHFQPGWARRAGDEPFGSVTTRDHHSLIVPYHTNGVARAAGDHAAPTVDTHDRLALIVPPNTNGACRNAGTQPSFVQVTETRPSLLEVPA